MTTWILIWKVCLIAALIVFAFMSVIVTVGGATDIRRLLKRLNGTMADEE